MLFGNSAYAARPFEGVWAQTKSECLDKEGPNSRTLIDLSNKDKGKSLPIFDQYEWHCKVLKIGANDKKTILKLRCFEYWEYFEKDTEGTDTKTILMPLSKQALKIDGKKFIRCQD